MADMIQKNTHIITNQIDEMLELSHNEATDSVSKDDNANVIELLEQLKQENYTYLHPEVKMLIDSSLAPGFTFRTNSSLLKRVLNALIDNAIKNTQHGSITLRAEADEAQLALTVEDTGCGVPAGEADRIFERFVKLDSFKAGLGLGLPLCKAIITRLGGSIRLDTSYNNGARFIVNLPL
jgi:signal transduction histidine kinase